jgi:hypothetical protein
MNIAMSKTFETDADLRQALAQLRNSGVGRVTGQLAAALRLYLQANDNRLPETTQQLAPYVSVEITPEMLGRFEMLRTGKVSDLPSMPRSGGPNAIIGFNGPIDLEFDQFNYVGLNGSTGAMGGWGRNFQIAMDRFSAANTDRQPATAAEIAPYLKWAMPPEQLERMWNMIVERLPAAGGAPRSPQP